MKTKISTISFALIACFAGAANAAVIATGSTAAAAAGSTTVGIPVTVTADGATGLIQANLNYDNTKITLAAANVTNGAGFTCSVNQALGRVSILGGNDTGPIAANSTVCTIAYPINAGAVLPTNLTITGQLCSTFDGNPTGQPCTVTNGTISGAVPVNPTLAYAPAAGTVGTPGTVTFPGGAAGAATTTISVTPTGSVAGGSTSVTGCAIAGGTPASFTAPTTTPANGIFTTTAGTVNLGCTRGAAAVTTTLTCQETPSGGAATPRVWTLNCPAGAVNTYTATPGPLAFGNSNIGTPTATQNIAVVAAGANTSAISITACTFGGTNPGDFGFSPAPTFPISVAAGATVNLPVRFTPAAAGARSGNVQCTTANAAAANFTTTFTGTGVTAQAVFGSTPVSGTTINLPATNVGVSTSASVLFANTGNASGTVSCTVAGAGFSVLPTGAQTIVAGGNQSFAVSASSVTATTLTGTLTCVPSVGANFTFPLSAVVNAQIVQQIPAVGDFGRFALLGLIAGLGAMVAFRKRG